MASENYRLTVDPLDLGADLRAIGLELVELTEDSDNPAARGAEAAAIWASALPALAGAEPWALDFFSHLDRLREFCRGHQIGFRDAASRCTVVAARLCNDAARGLVIRKGKDGVGCSPNLERSGLLQVFAFEEKAGSSQGIKRGRGEDGRAMNPWGNASVRVRNGFTTRGLIGGRFESRGSGHGIHSCNLVTGNAMLPVTLYSCLSCLVKEALWQVQGPIGLRGQNSAEKVLVFLTQHIFGT